MSTTPWTNGKFLYIYTHYIGKWIHRILLFLTKSNTMVLPSLKCWGGLRTITRFLSFKKLCVELIWDITLPWKTCHLDGRGHSVYANGSLNCMSNTIQIYIPWISYSNVSNNYPVYNERANTKMEKGKILWIGPSKHYTHHWSITSFKGRRPSADYTPSST